MTALFLDTNVIVDFAIQRKEFYPQAQALFSLAGAGEVDSIASALSFANLAYVLRKMPIAQSRAILSKTMELVEIASLEEVDLAAAFDQASTFTDIEDDVQHATALRTIAEVIITRDTEDFTAATLPVMTPADFLAQHSPPMA